MSLNRLRDVERICQAALDRDPHSRLAFVADACAGDDALRGEVESLLAQHREADSFMESPAVEGGGTGVAVAARVVIGQSIGPYQVVSLLGAGGMGEVYRGRDAKLARDVALKILPDSYSHEPEWLARFQREARVLASLNHPNIAAIYGFEDSTPAGALVLELVEGATLADRIAQGPIPVDEALPIARQIAEAIEAAHAHGIIHRDLKPANIKLRPDGVVKVLDFGLAKVVKPAGAHVTGVSPSPKITMTRSVVLLGTAAYMSPEQARGQAVDYRSDVWAFGCVLFEMLAGRPAFKGDTISDTIAGIVGKQPDWQALPPAAFAVRPLLARCLTKDPKRRLQAIGEARIQIEELTDGLPEEALTTRGTSSTRSQSAAWMAVVLLAVSGLVGALTWAVTRPPPETDALPWRFELVPPPTQSLVMNETGRVHAVSSDGRRIAYIATEDGIRKLMVRAIDSLDTRHLAGIASAREPFFSPDNRWIGFFDGVDLKRVPVTGGPPMTIAQNSSYVSRGASWGDDDSIVFAAQDGRGLKRVSAKGGEAMSLTTPDAAKGEANHWFPFVLPNGRGVLFTINGAEGLTRPQLAVLDLQTGRYRTLIRGSQAEYVETGHLVYVEAGTLHAVRFDPVRLEVVGEPAPVVPVAVTSITGAGNYAISRQGTLVYIPAVGESRGPQRSLVWVERTGRQTPLPTPLRAYAQLSLSPEGTRVALAIRGQEDDIWILNLARAGEPVRLTSGPSIDVWPVWTRDGQHIVFGSRREGPEQNLFAQAANGTGSVERLTNSPNYQAPGFVSPDGSVIGSDVGPRTGSDIVRFPWKRAARSAPGQRSVSSPRDVEALVQTSLSEAEAALSPNDRFLAYVSRTESGPSEVFVRPYPNVNDGWWQVSTGGGGRPVWSRNGNELFYIDAAGTLTAVPVQTTGPTFEWGDSVPLFKLAQGSSEGFLADYDVGRDGRFLMIKEHPAEGQAAVAPKMVIHLEFFEELKRLVPPAK